VLCSVLVWGAPGGAVGWGTALQARRSRVRFPMMSLEFFIDINNPSGRTMTLRLTQPLTEMCTRSISWGGKSDRCVVLTNLPPPCADCLEIWEPQPPGTLRACRGLEWDCFTFTLCNILVLLFKRPVSISRSLQQIVKKMGFTAS